MGEESVSTMALVFIVICFSLRDTLIEKNLYITSVSNFVGVQMLR